MIGGDLQAPRMIELANREDIVTSAAVIAKLRATRGAVRPGETRLAEIDDLRGRVGLIPGDTRATRAGRTPDGPCLGLGYLGLAIMDHDEDESADRENGKGRTRND
jgi:hypothetical protein